ncbi:MAG TPA: hypothetical protein VGK13_06465, partial [Methanocellaceae archaeon]
RFQSARVNNNTTNAVVQIAGAKILAPTTTAVIHYPASPTPAATPGFGPILIIVGLIGAAAAVVYTRK